jgi:hypothetical protein
MVGANTKVDLNKLPRSKLSAMKREARRLGMSPDDYALKLIEENFDLEQEARSTPWDELVEPFRKAFEGVPESELDAIVEKARRSGTKKRKSGR